MSLTVQVDRDNDVHDTTSDQTEVKDKLSPVEQQRSKISFAAQCALAGLATCILTTDLKAQVPVQLAGGDHIQADAQEVLPNLTGIEVHLLGGGTLMLKHKGNGYEVIGGNSENGTDSAFLGVLKKDGKLFTVASEGVDSKLEIKEFKSEMEIDYVNLYPDMAESFVGGELEYLASIEEKILAKPEGEKREKAKLAGYRMWKRAINDIYNFDGEKIKRGTVKLFQKYTPYMVLSWKGLTGGYNVVYTKVELKNLQEINQQMDRIFTKLGKK